ncbi:hypothetical protein IHQ56_04940 [Methylobacillus flagellatus]|uniref:hypothetical protein n=1 Tax=Methylobacillus flagellatus TaxID=405 RepID=UPI00285419DF|nr:hypothetical protein [Methylobacillus flagellatus]MDR5171159.1 hypothetical protein [Methylobacillus flagellatus]
MASAHILGYPRIGERRALKYAQEAFWKGDLTAAGLQEIGKGLREQHWSKQKRLDFITAGDFSSYDHVLDHAVMFGAIPRRFGLQGALSEHDYFALARGNAVQPAMKTARWFDTDYHYIVPELDADTGFTINAHEFLSQLDEAQARSRPVKAALLGPVSLLYLSGADGCDRLQLLDRLAEQYAHLLKELYHRKIACLQLEEPILALDLDNAWLGAFERAYAWFRTQRPAILLGTYFGNVARYQGFVTHLPVDGIHLDLVSAPEQLAPWLNALPGHWILSAGIVDGRGILRNDLRQSLGLLQPLAHKLGDRLWVAPSCSLLHVPATLAHEQAMDAATRSCLAFADEKIAEVVALARGLNEGEASIAEDLLVSDAAVRLRHACCVKADDNLTVLVARKPVA